MSSAVNPAQEASINVMPAPRGGRDMSYVEALDSGLVGASLKAGRKDAACLARFVKTLGLDDTMCNAVARNLLMAQELKHEGRRWKLKGDRLHAVQIVSAALVPVLIGVLGSFENASIDLVIRIVAICLSIVGTISKAIEDVYNLRQRGQTRVAYGDKMFVAFDEYASLCGKDYDPDWCKATVKIPDLRGVPLNLLKVHIAALETEAAEESAQLVKPHAHSAAFRRYMAMISGLSAEARAAAFLGHRQTEAPKEE